MYQSFYNLDKKPFELNPDPTFLWLGEKHKEAFEKLRYGVLENKGFLFLTGAAGIGKTLLLKALTESSNKGVKWAIITDPQLERIDFYNAIARGFGMEKEFTSKVQFLIQFSHFLHKTDDENKKVLLVVDDCHLLSQEMLEELRLLSNIEKADEKLINILFVGQPEFSDMLVQPRNRAVRQRLTLEVELHSLDVSETEDYIRHRLKVAGTEEKIFTAKAIRVIQRFSRGIPRQLNAICSHAMESGAVQNKQSIDNKLIESSVQEMDMPLNPLQEDFVISPDFNPSNGRFVPKPAPIAPSFSGFNLENDNRRDWVKYGLVLSVLLLAGGYFWFPAPHSVEEAEKVPVVIEQEPVLKVISQASSSPAVTMLGKSKSEINGKKADELKTAILEKAYSNSQKKEETKNLQAEEIRVEDVPPAKEVHQQVEALSVDKVGNQLGQKISDQAVSEHVAPEKTESARVAPMEPRKVILELRSNSLKLTNAGLKELDRFVEKLKLYPRATVLVKGFVSAQTNSPENIKLSEERAMGVQKLMLARGIDVEQIEVVGMGNQEPIASNNTREGRKKNRRVEIVVMSDGVQKDGGD